MDNTQNNTALKKRWLIYTAIYLILPTILLVLIFNLKPHNSSTINTVFIDKENNTLVVNGKNFTSNISAIITPNIQKQGTILSSRYTWGQPFDLGLQKNHLWIANGNNGLLSYNIKDPDNPFLEGALSIKARTWKMDINGDKAFIAGGNCGLFGIDISNPTMPVLKFNNYTDKVILAVANYGNLTVIGTAKSGLIFLDTHDMSNPQQLAILPVNGSIQAITIYKNRVYAAGSKHQKGFLHVIDISQQHFKKTTGVKLPYSAWDCAITGSKLLLALGNHGVYSLDISSPDKITAAIHSTIQHRSFGLDINGNNLLVSSATDRLYLYKINNTFKLAATFILPNSCRNACSYKNLIFSTIGNSGFAIINSASSGHIHRANIPLPALKIQTADIINNGKEICVKNDTTLYLLKKSPSGDIQLYDSLDLHQKIKYFNMDSAYVYLVLKNNELHILSLDPLEQQRTQSILSFNNAIHSIAVDNNHLYLAQAKAKLTKVILDNITLPQIATIPLITNLLAQIFVANNLLYIAAPPNNFEIYRLNTNEEPTLQGKLHIPLPAQIRMISTSLAIHNRYAFVAEGKHGIFSFDISNSGKPELCSSLWIEGFCKRIITGGNYAYVTTSLGCVIMVDISDPAKMRVIGKLPATQAVSMLKGELLELQDDGIVRANPPHPLAIINNNDHSVVFDLPKSEQNSSFDLQIATGNTEKELTIYQNLLHYSPQQGWEVTRKISE
ncbi:MAG: hypothetical protein B6I36_07885 [Desulfobacteraceae bacterium 4572_35.1]|nr:MAG: hypothetical protein B6I36_07885 [Desulfobacteraceae bacterium 4572_35.1]